MKIIDEIDKNCKQDVTMDYMLSEIYQRSDIKARQTIYDGRRNRTQGCIFCGTYRCR